MIFNPIPFFSQLLGSNATPSSLTRKDTAPLEASSATTTDLARPCLIALFKASWAILKRWTACVLSRTLTDPTQTKEHEIPASLEVLDASSFNADSRPPSS